MLRFQLDYIHNRPVRNWIGDGHCSWETVARRWAAEHGAAGAWRANGSLVLFYRDGDGSVRRKTFRSAAPSGGVHSVS